MKNNQSFESEKDSSWGEDWEPTESDDTQGIHKGDRIRLTSTSKPIEGTVVGFSKKFGIKQIRVELDLEPGKISTFELGHQMEKIS